MALATEASRNHRLLFILTTVLVLGAVFWGIDRPFHTRGEAREALTAQAMVAGESWILPRVYDDRVPSKPPFMHWIMAASAALLGDEMSEAAARMPSAIAALVFFGFFYLWIKRYLGPDRALLSSIILVTSFEWARAAVTSRVDLIFAVAVSVAALSVIDLARAARVRQAQLVLAVSLVIGFLTKGPAALILVGGFAVALAVDRRDLAILRSSIWPWVLALSLPCIWYYLAFQTGGDDFIAKVISENYRRFTGTMDDQPHVHGVAYLVGVLLLGFLPWTIVVVGGFRSFKWPSRGEEYIVLRALGIFALLVFVFFSIPSSKRGVYLLPMYPALAALAGNWLHGQRSRALNCIAGVLGLIVLASVLRVPQFFSSTNRELFKSATTLSVPEILVGLSIGGALIFSAMRVRSIEKIGVLVLAALMFVNGTILSRVAVYLTPKDFSLQVVESGIPSGGLQSYRRDAYGIAYYTKGAVGDFKECRGDVGYIVPQSLVSEFSSKCGEIVEVVRSAHGVIKAKDIWVYVRLKDPR